MKFGRKFEQSKIPEWADFYLSYKLLKKFLSPFNALKKVYLRSTINNNTISIHNFSLTEVQKLHQFSNEFENTIFEDLEKVLVFYTQKLSHVITKWKKIRINMMIFKEKRDTLNKDVKEQQFSMLKQAYHVLLRELKLMSEYVTVNLEAVQKIIKKYNKVVKLFFPEDTLKDRVEKYLLETRIFTMRDRLNNFLSSVESEYCNFFYKNKIEGIKALRKITQGSLISKNETFWFGLFLGFAALLLILIIELSIEEGHDVDEDQVLKEIWPMFRGMAIIVIYMGLLAWNVYGWTKYNVNYKLIFRFNHHYSQLSQILKRAAVFAAGLLLLMLWYLILDANLGKISRGIDFIPKDLLPLFLWLGFIIYMFFPSTKIFNGPGRLYLFRLFKNIFKVPFIPVIFPIIWATDQLTSFVLPLKDTEYTFCYYINYFFNDSALAECQSSKRFTKGVIMAVVPTTLRIIQCLRQAYDGSPNRKDPLMNTGKYCCSILASVLSYMVTVSNNETRYLVAWIVFAGISTVYSYYWDLKKDWAFLQPNSKHRFLRDQLSYHKPWFYYGALSANLVMRLAWVLSISPDIIDNLLKPEISKFVIACIEILRRSVWNFLRVEKEHLANVGSFKAVPDLQLPYDDIVFKNQTQQDYFNIELEKIMHNNNKSEKPISMGNYLPYRTNVANLAENYNRLNNPTSVINLANLMKSSENKSAFKHFSAIPFKATAIGSMSEEERAILLKELESHREEEAHKYKVWAKEVKNFKLHLKDQESRFIVIDIDNEPLVIQETDHGIKTLESERKTMLNPTKTNKVQDIPQNIKPKKLLPHRYQSVVQHVEHHDLGSDFVPPGESELAIKRRRKSTTNVHVDDDFFKDVMKQEKSLWGHNDDGSPKQLPLKSKFANANLQNLNREITFSVDDKKLPLNLDLPHQTQTTVTNLNKDSRVFTSLSSEESQLETQKTVDEASPTLPKDGMVVIHLGSPQNTQKTKSSSHSSNSDENDNTLQLPPKLQDHQNIPNKNPENENHENIDPNKHRNDTSFEIQLIKKDSDT